MKIALAQIDPIIGDLAGNRSIILDQAQEAARRGADLVVLPELALSGYPPMDLLLRPGFKEACLETLESLQPPIPMLLGAPVYGYNAAVLSKPDGSREVFCKRLLPNYEVFYESRYFRSGPMEPMFAEVAGCRLAVLICEDLLAWEDENLCYDRNPVEHSRGADMVVCLASSPYRRSKPESREETCRTVAEHLACPVALVNQVGANDGLIFDGNSLLVSAQGEVLYRAQAFETDLLLADTSASVSSAPAPSGSTSQEITKALVCGLGDYFRKTGFRRAVLGLSGGVDSALTCCLAVDALGPDNVLALLLPAPYSSSASTRDAQELCQAVGVEARVLPIDALLEAFLDTTGYPKLSLAEENAQARLRSLLLMGVANHEDRLLLASSNKSELAVGYSTIYGDSCGAIAPIGDLYKTEVWNLAEAVYGDRISQRILRKEPSAELSPGQKDSDSLPDYWTLDSILEMYLEQRLEIEEIAAAGYDTQLIESVVSRIHRSEYKRSLAPTILKVSDCAFDRLGWRWQIAKRIKGLSS